MWAPGLFSHGSGPGAGGGDGATLGVVESELRKGG